MLLTSGAGSGCSFNCSKARCRKSPCAYPGAQSNSPVRAWCTQSSFAASVFGNSMSNAFGDAPSSLTEVVAELALLKSFLQRLVQITQLQLCCLLRGFLCRWPLLLLALLAAARPLDQLV